MRSLHDPGQVQPQQNKQHWLLIWGFYESMKHSYSAVCQSEIIVTCDDKMFLL